MKPIVSKLLPCDVVSHRRMRGEWVRPNASMANLHPELSVGQILSEGHDAVGTHRGTVGWYDQEGQPSLSSFSQLCRLEILADPPALPAPTRKVVVRV